MDNSEQNDEKSHEGDEEQFYNDENDDFDQEYDENLQNIPQQQQQGGGGGGGGGRGEYRGRPWGPRFPRGGGGRGMMRGRGRGGGGRQFHQNWQQQNQHQNQHQNQQQQNQQHQNQQHQNQQQQNQQQQNQQQQNQHGSANFQNASNSDIWVETKTAEGKSYYYNAFTRETTWSRPINCRIMTQSEVETLNKQTNDKQASQENKEPVADVVQEQKPVEQAIPQTMAPPVVASNPFPGHFNMPQFGMPPPGYQGFPPNQWAPWPFPGVDPVKFNAIKMTDLDPGVVTKAGEWTEHKAPDGRPYFYNASKNESVWEKPQALKDLEAAKLAFYHTTQQQHQPPAVQFMPPPQPNMMPPQMQPPIHQQIPGQNAIVFDQLAFMVKNDGKALMEDEKEKKRKQELEKKKKEDEERAKAKPQDKTRPISSTPIAGTPWCVVWTGDARVFFYNPSTRTSVWDRPEDLLNRADVDKAVSVPPQQLLGNVPKEVEEEKKVLENVVKIGQKRSESESSEESEETPTKKLKTDIEVVAVKPDVPVPIVTPTKPVQVIPNPQDGVENAVEAEIKAAKERALVPLDVRMKSFKEMLREKEVSAFSTWEKELHKIVFDPRYLLLTSKERKQVFERYVKDRADEERREKRNKMRQKRDEFRTLLEAAHLHGKSSFSDFAQKYGKDERFKVIEKIRERESLFNEYIVEIRKKEKDDKISKKEQLKKDFIGMLREYPEIDRHTRWSEVKKKVDGEQRYRSVGDPLLKEDYFLEYCKILKDEKKRAKEKKEKKKKDKDRRRSRSRDRSEEKGDDTDIDQEDGEHPLTSEDEADRQQKERERQLRAEASIKEREKEVQRTLATHLRDRDKERQHHQRDEAIRHFNALLADLVRNADLTWKEVKKQLKKDHRYELVEMLDRDDRERIFGEHISALTRKKRDKFREMLDELAQLELTSSWKDIKRVIREDPRYTKFSSSEKCEREFRDYLKDKTMSAKAAFRELLQECKFITHKSYDLFRENANHLREIEDILRNDKRYLVLDHMYHERTQMIMYYLEDLNKRGPPPPPTASDSAARRK